MEAVSIQGVTPPPISFPSIGSTLGALLICTFVTLMLYGIAVHQTYRYVYLYPADALILKFIAYSLFYHYLITDFQNPLDLGRNIWSSQQYTILVVILKLLHAANFKLRYRVLVSVAVGSMMLTELGLVTANTCKAFIATDYEGTYKFFRLDSGLFGVAILTDCTLTGTLVAILHSRRTEFAHTNNVLNTLALYAVIATALNTALTIPAFAFVVVQPYNFIWIAISTPVTKVYSNSVLAM
ncbi:hypothetical protein C8Q74DRAFT_1372511 [Fomes fomentarius]|nr:hypothetical protein C8Q74DRAFT_1372511 [Fomes fomentarius]